LFRIRIRVLEMLKGISHPENKEITAGEIQAEGDYVLC
jgi:hypothetical protein